MGLGTVPPLWAYVGPGDCGKKPNPSHEGVPQMRTSVAPLILASHFAFARSNSASVTGRTSAYPISRVASRATSAVRRGHLLHLQVSTHAAALEVIFISAAKPPSVISALSDDHSSGIGGKEP